jgi:hypothetical protein
VLANSGVGQFLSQQQFYVFKQQQAPTKLAEPLNDIRFAYSKAINTVISQNGNARYLDSTATRCGSLLLPAMRQPFTKGVPLSIYLLCPTSRNRLIIYSSLVGLVFWYPSTKPSQTGPQYKCHTAYCSKSKDRTRLRSYRVCSAAKIKYNYCAPCQQCVRKGVRCVYDL